MLWFGVDLCNGWIYKKSFKNILCYGSAVVFIKRELIQQRI